MADIEIVVKGLIHLFTYTKQHNMKEISFILPQSEAINIYCFEGQFEELSAFTTQRDKRVGLTLSCAFQYYFLERIAELKQKLNQELWVRQREDKGIKYFLQNGNNGNFNFMSQDLRPSHQATIIQFSNQRG